MTAEPQDITEQLRQTIRDSGRTLNNLGRQAGIDSGRLSRFMRGERDLTGAAMAKLCAALGLRLVGTEGQGADPKSDESKLAEEEKTEQARRAKAARRSRGAHYPHKN